ncbi:phage tail protein I [Pannonibacter tanglangensis]|uniref:Phage tail protein I n=1 Tax=Pannonibacter tanglangensis TaxID=2750084 RepID=A0ABW9ZD69_9HYPH|nr:phage tail protein I [Pannonibacter sp. XCT-34]NBN62783.1 phage tail protein I [Pannonibacter sp. XCT-34]
MTHRARDLLPASSDPFERAALQAMIDDLPVPLQRCLDPDTCPAEFLPFLAHANSVDLWSDDWSEERKRQVIREWPDLAARIGTLSAIRQALRYVDAELVDVMVPPARFVVGSLDDAGIAAWKARLPQLRIYNRVRSAPKVGTPWRRFVVGRTAVVPEVAWAYAGEEGVLYDPATDTETSLRSVDLRRVRRDTVETTQRVAIIPGRASKRAPVVGRMILGRSILGAFRQTTVVSWTEVEQGVELSTEGRVVVAGGGWSPINPFWEEIPVRTPKRGQHVIGRFIVGRSTVTRQKAELSYFRRLYLSNPNLVMPGTRSFGRAVIGRTPIQQPSHQARLLIELKQRRTRRGFVVGRSTYRSATIRTLDDRAMQLALTVLRIVKAPDERHLVDFATRRRVTFGDAVLLDGAVTFGTYVDRRKL